VRDLTEQEFARRVHEVVAALAQDHLAKIGELKRRFYA